MSYFTKYGLNYSFEGSKCPSLFPNAFMWGTYCCKNKNESIAENHFDECDGSPLSIDSICCQNDEYIKCPSVEGCTGKRGNRFLLIPNVGNFKYTNTINLQNDIHVYCNYSILRCF